MLLGLGVVTALWCVGCQLADGAPTRPLQPPREALVNQQLSDGCTRFALRVVNGVAQVEALYNTNGCQSDQLQLQADSAPTYDAATGTVRVPIVIKNLGTVAVVAPTRLRFNADSSQFLNAQGQVMAGMPNILAVNYDTANANGRSGQWRYDTLLAASGQAQVLPRGDVAAAVAGVHGDRVEPDGADQAADGGDAGGGGGVRSPARQHAEEPFH